MFNFTVLLFFAEYGVFRFRAIGLHEIRDFPLGRHNSGSLKVSLYRVPSFSSFRLRGVSFFVLSPSRFLILTTCQVGHFDSHLFWSLIEILVLTGGRYIWSPIHSSVEKISK